MKKYNTDIILISKSFLEDTSVSFGVKGLYCYLMTKPENWCFNCEDIMQNFKITQDQINNSMQLLIEKRYIKQEQKEDGSIKYSFVDPSNIKIENKKNNKILEKTKTQLESEKYEVYSIRLKKYVESRKRKKITDSNILNWNNTFRKLFKELKDFRTDEEAKRSIENVFFYLENENDSQGQYKFIVESAESFKEKFTKIEDKIKKYNNFRNNYNKNNINYEKLEKTIL